LTKTIFGQNLLLEKVREINAKYQNEKLTVPIRRAIVKELRRAARVCLGEEEGKQWFVVERPPKSGIIVLQRTGSDLEAPFLKLNLVEP